MDPSAVGEALQEEPHCPSFEVVGDHSHDNGKNDASTNHQQKLSRQDQGFRKIVRNFTPS